jgi:hypothetical protein
MDGAYCGSIPTMTALGVPQTAFSPVWLLRQTIFIGLAGVGAGAGVAAAGGDAGWAGP